MANSSMHAAYEVIALENTSAKGNGPWERKQRLSLTGATLQTCRRDRTVAAGQGHVAPGSHGGTGCGTWCPGCLVSGLALAESRGRAQGFACLGGRKPAAR